MIVNVIAIPVANICCLLEIATILLCAVADLYVSVLCHRSYRHKAHDN